MSDKTFTQIPDKELYLLLDIKNAAERLLLKIDVLEERWADEHDELQRLIYHWRNDV